MAMTKKPQRHLTHLSLTNLVPVSNTARAKKRDVFVRLQLEYGQAVLPRLAFVRELRRKNLEGSLNRMIEDGYFTEVEFDEVGKVLPVPQEPET